MRFPAPVSKNVLARILFLVVTGASISLSQAEDQNALHKECFRQNKARSCVRLGTTLWQNPSQRSEARAAFTKGCELKEESACTLKEMGVSTSDEGAVALGASVPAKAEAGKFEGIERTGPAHYKISRKIVSKYAGDLENTLSTAEMSKHSMDGKVIGYKFKSIDKGSVFAALGFQKDDVILRVNEQSISTPEDAMALLPSLLYGSTDHYLVHASRRGKTTSQRYEIVE